MELEKWTHNIIGAAMEVHNTLGNGFQEVIYQRALAIEMQMRDINFGSKSLQFKRVHNNKLNTES